ncbi:hypothetical protein MHO82_18410 [Vibrio sp. Of7-15]|uniref:hypothetical protein n=1 Tax=Vibrio sp. Of7-15 TaxID=2724879 RepID=UPI001EF2B85A|nr:hypothetical protein [Vibrio sp. Of7-15]MCG7498846.1 hypothetical protein [Vibrio sp. Of7-15]
MKNVFFVNHDDNRGERQSYGVEFCVIPEFHDNKIYFYCSEYSMFWSAIEDVGNFDKCCSFKLQNTIRPATLKEIEMEKLCSYVDAVKECTFENNKLKGVKYIKLK